MAEKEGEALHTTLASLTRKVEQIEAWVVAFASLREAYNTRFTMLSEKWCRRAHHRGNCASCWSHVSRGPASPEPR